MDDDCCELQITVTNINGRGGGVGNSKIVTIDVKESTLYLFDTKSGVVAFSPYVLGCHTDGFCTFPPIFHTHRRPGFFVCPEGFPRIWEFGHQNLEGQASQNSCHSSLSVLVGEMK